MSMLRTRRAAVATTMLVLVASASAPPAARALDLTGTWAGRQTCTEFDGGRTMYVLEGTLEVTQSGATLGITFMSAGHEDGYVGRAVVDDGNRDRGEIVLLHCGTNDVAGDAHFDEVGRLKVSTKPAEGTGRISGTSIFSNPLPASVGSCRWSFNRVATDDPGARTICP